MTDQEAFKTLLALKCGACGGLGARECNCGSPPHRNDEPVLPYCPDCSGTGLLLSGLVTECKQCKVGTPNKERPWMRQNCPHCHGTGWAPVAAEKALDWLLDWLLEDGYDVRFGRDYDDDEQKADFYCIIYLGMTKSMAFQHGDTKFQALAAAIAQKEGR